MAGALAHVAKHKRPGSNISVTSKAKKKRKLRESDNQSDELERGVSENVLEPKQLISEKMASTPAKHKHSASASADIGVTKNVNKKRKQSEGEVQLNEGQSTVSDNVSPKKKENFNVVEFIFRLRDANTTFAALDQFISSAEDFPAQSDYDLVKEFCLSSKDGSEILAVLEAGKRKPAEYQLIFSSLEQILMRIAEDLTQFESCGTAIVQRLLESHMGAVFYQLAMRNKSSQIKSGLKLLTAMAMLNADSARDVLTQIQFSNSLTDLYSLFYRRDVKDPQDVRTCVVLFVMAFLVMGNEGLTKQLLEQKFLLQAVFKDIHMDKLLTIQAVLPTVLTQVVNNPAISKTLKVKLFNEYTLQHLCKLFKWTGPVKWNAKTSKGGAEMSDVEMQPEVEEDRGMVVELTQTFLTQLCCSQKTGITFYDNTYGTSSRMLNPLLTSLLASLKAHLREGGVRELVVSILETCPDQLEGYVTQLKASLTPRPSPAFFERVHFLCQIYERVPSTAPLTKLSAHVEVPTLLSMVQKLILPPVSEEILLGLKHKDIGVRDSMLELVLVILKKARSVRETWSQRGELAGVYTPSERSEFTQGLTDMLTKNLPSLHVIMNNWQRLFEPVSQNKKTDTGEQKSDVGGTGAETWGQAADNVSSISQLENLIKIEEVLCLYVDIFPRTVTAELLNVATLLEGVREKLSGQVTGSDPKVTEKTRLLQLNLLKILSSTDSKQVPWTRVTGGGNSVALLLLEMLMDTSRDAQLFRQAQRLLTKMIIGTGFFEMTPHEIPVWLKHIQTCQPDVMRYFAKMLTTFLMNPYPYMDKVVESFSEQPMTEDKDMETASVATADSIDVLLDHEDVDELLEKDSERLHQSVCTPDGGVEDDTDTRRERFPFSPLVVVAMETLEKDNKGCVEFLSHVLVDLVNSQRDPVSLCGLIQRSENLLTHTPLLPYFLSWLPHNLKQDRGGRGVDDTGLPDGLCTQLIRLYQHFPELSKDKRYLNGLYRLMGEVGTEPSLCAVQQITLYIRTAVSRYDKKPKSSKAEINLYFQLLGNLLERTFAKQSAPKEESEVHNSPDHHGNSADSECSKVLEQLADTVFGDSVFRGCFLSHSMLNESQTVVLETKPFNGTLCKLVTLQMSELVKNVDMSQVTNMRNKVRFYVQKISVLLADCASDGSKLDMMFEESVMAAVDGFLFYFSPSDLTRAAQSLLLLPYHRASFQKSPNFSQYEALVADILQKLSAGEGQDTRLPLHHIGKVFDLMVSADIRDLHQPCLALVRRWPHYALATEPQTLEYLLGIADTVTLDLSAKLVSQNSVLRRHFTQWLTKVSPEECHKYAGVSLACVQALLAVGDMSCVGVMKKKLCPILSPWVLSLPASHLTSEDPHTAHLWLTLISYTDQKFLKKVFVGLTKRVRETPSAVCPLQLETLRVSADRLTSDTGADTTWQLLTACLRTLVGVVGKGDRTEMREALLVIIQTQLKNTQIDDMEVDELSQMWPSLVKCILKWCYTDGRAVGVLTELLPLVYRPPTECSLPEGQLYEMVMSHSQCLPVLFDEESASAKESLVSLLLGVVERCPACCQSFHVPIILGAYHATLTKTDQRLLKLLMQYEKSGMDLTSYKPFLWGAKARQFYSMKNKGRSLRNQVTPGQVLDLLEKDRLAKSIHNFPLRQTLQSEEVVDASDLKSEEGCYDPKFLLTVFIHILGPENVVDCQQFVECRALGYLFASLSCHDEAVRSMGYLALSLFSQHVDGSRFTGRDQVLYLLQTFQNSLTEPNTKLACIITHFYDKALVTLCKPESHMFVMVNAFLLLKPDMDLLNVPEFYKFFNSSAFEYKQERGWMLELLTTGLRETSDYRIYQRRYIFKLLLSFYQCPLSDNWCKVLRIVHAACREKTVASDLVRKHGLLTAISGMVENSQGHPDRLCLIISVVDQLWITMVTKRKRPPAVYDPLRPEVLVILRQIIHSFSDLTPLTSACQCLSTLLTILDTVDDHQVDPVISVLDMACLLLYYTTAVKDESAEQKLCDSVQAAGFRCPEKTNRQHSSKHQASDNFGSSKELDTSTAGNSESLLKFVDLLLRVSACWLPSNLPELVTETTSCSFIATLCVMVLRIFSSNLPKDSSDVSKLLQWLGKWLTCDSQVSRCLAGEILQDAGQDGRPSLLTSLLGLYSRLTEGVWEGKASRVGQDGGCGGVRDHSEEIRVLNTICVSLKTHLHGSVPDSMETSDTDCMTEEDCTAVRTFLWDTSLKTSSL